MLASGFWLASFFGGAGAAFGAASGFLGFLCDRVRGTSGAGGDHATRDAKVGLAESDGSDATTRC